jgi:uncharacterized repeat protein (TIGR03803 family)
VGGTSNGTVFAINTDGTGFQTLHSFTPTTGTSGITGTGANADGALPYAGLVLSGNTLCGTTEAGGASGNGTVFTINTDGNGFQTLHSFSAALPPTYAINSDGAFPNGALILSGNTLYGTAYAGGSTSWGTVFAMNTNGGGFRTLHNFTEPSGTAGVEGYGVNSDGTGPAAVLLLSSNTLYGTTTAGGSSGNGTVFKLNVDGGGFETLHSFTATIGTSGESGVGANSDGAEPEAGLVLSGSTLYGTTRVGGGSGNGTVFAITTDGTGFQTLHSFTAGSGTAPTIINSDGFNPVGGLILSGNTLYGTAEVGGSGGWGTLFAINTDGAGFTNLHSFAPTDDGGALPVAGLLLSGNTLYGTTKGGGVVAPSSGGLRAGTVFSFSLAAFSSPQLTITPSAASVVLTWPTNATGFALQSTTDLAPPILWNSNSPLPLVVNGQNTVTIPSSGIQQFYRLVWSTNSQSPAVVNGENTVTNPSPGTQQFYRLSQ